MRLALSVLTLLASTAAAAQTAPQISLDTLKQVTERLASDEFEGRAPTTPGEAKTLAYLVERFEKAGGTPLTAPRAIPYATEKGPGNKVCYCRMPWGTTMEFITTPDRMAYHDQTDLRRWQDED